MITLPIALLQQAFGPLSKVIPRRTGLPVLSCLHVERREHEVRITATDLDHYLTFTCAVEPRPLTALARSLAALRWKREAAALLVPAALLRTALRAADDRAGSIHLEADAVSYPVAGQLLRLPFAPLPADQEFPPVPENRETSVWTFAPVARGALLSTARFASDDSTRHVLEGVFCDGRDQVFVATDGRRMCHSRHADLSGHPDLQFIIPSAAIRLLSQPALVAQDWHLAPHPKRAALSLTAGPWHLYTRLIEGNYPDYRRVIPVDTGLRAVLTTATHRQLMEVLKGLPKSADHERVVFTFHQDRLDLAYPSAGLSLSVLGITCTSEVTVALNRIYVLDMLSLGEGEFSLVDAMTPVVYRAGAAAVVTMPLRPAAAQPAVPAGSTQAAA